MSASGHGVEFTFDGQTIRGVEGQSVTGALHAAGQHVLSRSFKYHRPRGLLCGSGRCPNCLCTVDGTPNVRICTTDVQPGMQVKSQNRFPSLGFDVLGVFDWFHKLMPVGFYYKKFYKPRWMWPFWEKFIRRIAGLGEINQARGGEGHYEKLNLFTDVAVIGGGLAGLNAAFEAAEAGASVVVIDDQKTLGGHLRHDPTLKPADFDSLVAKVTSHANIEVFTSATAIGAYEENYIAALQGKRLIRIRAAQAVFTSGAWERPLVFTRNDLPGVMLASAAQRLIHLDHVKINGPVVIVTDNAQGYRTAAQIVAAKGSIASLIDLRDAPPAADADLVKSLNIPVQAGRTIVAAEGSKHVTGATVALKNGSERRTISCRWIVQAVGFTPATSLLYQSGCGFVHDDRLGHVTITKFAKDVHAAGAITGAHDLTRAAWEGRRAGLAAAIAARPDDQSLDAKRSTLESSAPPAPAAGPAPTAAVLTPETALHFVSPGGEKKKFVCYCEDVTQKDVFDAIDEGYSNIETLKRYSTISMGPCQGKMCQASSVALCALHNKQSIEATGVPTSRPPETPTPLGALAGRTPHFVLTRRTPMHGWHERAGAKFMDAGNWKRPERYTSPEEEYKAVREAAGLIDVSTLGKLELRGRDVVPFLEQMYPNKYADLKEGRTRYGIVCDGGGIILDDGTISRLGPDRYFLTTTTGNADAIESWFRWNLAAKPEWDVTLVNVSSNYAAMNLAGPKSREILRGLTTADISSSALPYLAVGQFDIVGVPAIVFRIGFVGELGYEIHVPSEHGLYVWEKIYQAGQPFGLKPFGVEAQRRLRLDKKHILVSIDTDALSNPLEADLGWIVKFDKTDFVGKRTLHQCHTRGPQNRLVGFKMTDDANPPEASLVLHDGRLAGRVTSCRFSPAAGTHVGLAWVPVELGKDGTSFNITIDGIPHEAVVQDAPFYDPKGEKLRS